MITDNDLNRIEQLARQQRHGMRPTAVYWDDLEALVAEVRALRAANEALRDSR